MFSKLPLVALPLLLFTGCATAPTSSPTEAPQSAQVITLTQTGCQFLETETVDHQYQPKSSEDCKAINAKSLSDRQTAFKSLTLPAGDYIFRVTNKNVPYELGFYLRGQGAQGALLPKVSGGGLNPDVTQDYRITLRPGSYVFSCPLNPTPDYPLIVQ
jgi:hypothetical protein